MSIVKSDESGEVVFSGSVYVDDRFEPMDTGGSFDRWCRLYADNEDELHQFAELIGLHPSLYQSGEEENYLSYYQVNEQFRRTAIAEGALEISQKTDLTATEGNSMQLLTCENGDCDFSQEVTAENIHDIRLAHSNQAHKHEATLNYTVTTVDRTEGSNEGNDGQEQVQGQGVSEGIVTTG